MKHPGGQRLLEVARKEEDSAGLLFLSYHMGSDLSGKVLPAARALGAKTPQRGPIYDEIHEAVCKAKAEHPNQHDAFLAWCLMLSAAIGPLFLWFLFVPSLLSSSATAMVFALYFLNVFHTRHHVGGQLYQSPALNRITEPFYNFIDRTWGYEPKAWCEDHHVKHHVYTNESATDNTVPAIYPAIRCVEDQPKFWFHKLQTLYWPVLSGFAGISFPLNNVLFHRGSIYDFGSWLMMMLVLPMYLHGWEGPAYSMLMLGMTGSGLAYVFAVSHTHCDLSSRSRPGKYSHIDEWIASQVEESMSWGGYCTTFLLGAINLQIEHHIAPALDPPLYHFLAPEIQRICCKHGIRYTAEPSFFHAVWQFHLQLWKMGR
jgi:hypothetical protein